MPVRDSNPCPSAGGWNLPHFGGSGVAGAAVCGWGARGWVAGVAGGQVGRRRLLQLQMTGSARPAARSSAASDSSCPASPGPPSSGPARGSTCSSNGCTGPANQNKNFLFILSKTCHAEPVVIKSNAPGFAEFFFFEKNSKVDNELRQGIEIYQNNTLTYRAFDRASSA